MIPVIKWLYLLALAVWIGSVAFFSFVVAPTVFRILKPEDAARLQRALFPWYYLVGMACAGAGIVCVGCLLAERAFGKWPGVLSLMLLAATAGTNLWLRQAVVPQMNALRERVASARAEGRSLDPKLDREWKALHRLSVQLNGAVLVCMLVLLWLVVHARVV